MNYKEKLKIFEKRFDCAYNQILKTNLVPSTKVWNLFVSPSSKIFSLNDVEHFLETNPCAFDLLGKK